MRYLKFLIFCFLVIACTQEKEQIPPVPDADEPDQKVVIYQLMTRLFGNKTTVNKTFGTLQENGVGKFNDINDQALAGIHAIGATHVWYTGIIEHATQSDYTSFNIQNII